MNSRRGHGFVFLRGRSRSAADDRARVAHAASRRRGLPGNQTHDGLFHVRFDVLGSLFLRVAADFADHHDGVRFGIFVEQADRIEERRADNRIAADADAGGLADAELASVGPRLHRSAFRCG